MDKNIAMKLLPETVKNLFNLRKKGFNSGNLLLRPTGLSSDAILAIKIKHEKKKKKKETNDE